MAAALFPDNTVLCNFAAVHRLDILEGFFRGRGRWVEAIAHEVHQSAGHLPDLAGVGEWLGEPIEITDPEEQRRIDVIRRDVFGGRSDRPLRHLGEAQTCFLLKEHPTWRGSWWVSDDTDAVRYARTQGLVVRETVDIVREIIQDGDLTGQRGWELMLAMEAAGRSLRMPSNAASLER